MPMTTAIIFFALALGGVTGYIVGFVQGYERREKEEKDD